MILDYAMLKSISVLSIFTFYDKKNVKTITKI